MSPVAVSHGPALEPGRIKDFDAVLGESPQELALKARAWRFALGRFGKLEDEIGEFGIFQFWIPNLSVESKWELNFWNLLCLNLWNLPFLDSLFKSRMDLNAWNQKTLGFNQSATPMLTVSYGSRIPRQHTPILYNSVHVWPVEVGKYGNFRHHQCTRDNHLPSKMGGCPIERDHSND